MSPCEIKLVDVPELGCLRNDQLHRCKSCIGRGEILVRGPTVLRDITKMRKRRRRRLMRKGGFIVVILVFGQCY